MNMYVVIVELPRKKRQVGFKTKKFVVGALSAQDAKERVLEQDMPQGALILNVAKVEGTVVEVEVLSAKYATGAWE